VAKYRQAFKPSRAKDDPTDAALLAELLCKHRDHLHAWEPQSTELRTLAQLVESRRILVGDKVRLSNRITAALKNYYPQVLEWFEDKDTQVFCDFILEYPTLNAAQAASADELTTFFRQHNVVRQSAIISRLGQIEAGMALTEDESVIETMKLLVNTWIQQLKILLLSIQAFDLEIEKIFTAHPDAILFSSLPGAGPHLAPRLLVAFGEDRERYQSAQEVLRYAGIAPVKEKSGKKEWIHWQASPEGGFPSVGNWRAGVVLLFYVRRLLNGRIILGFSHFGRVNFMTTKGGMGSSIKWQFVRWHSSGFGFCIDAGKSANLMTK
jgi:transposase